MTELSIVIVSLVGGKALVSYLESIKKFPGEHLVMFDSNKNNMSDLQQLFPAMHFIARDDLTVPMARKLGVDHATGGIVALLEDTSLPTSGWYDAVAAVFANKGVVAAAGPVVLSNNLGGRYLALGCGEYGRFHPDRYSLLADEQAGSKTGTGGLMEVTSLPGNNLLYRRKQLQEMLDGKEHGLIEGEINEQLRTNGHVLVMHPAMSVNYCNMDNHGARLKTRYNHGRLFAGNRVAGQGWGTRITWFIKSMLLPIVLSARGCSSMTSAVESSAWPKVMAWIFLMETAWSLGEATGYLRGAGRSMEAWR